MEETGEGARVLHGAPIADRLVAEAAALIAEAGVPPGRMPSLAVLIVGHDPASHVYVRGILRVAERIGSRGRLVELPADAADAEVTARLRALSDDPAVGGVIVQMPLPGHIDQAALMEVLDPAKDLDGLHPYNAGLIAQGRGGFAPSCAEACLQVLRESGIALAGRSATVIGRSNVVGRPAARLLLLEHATVTVCHRRTVDLAAEVRRADIVVSAAGSPGLVRGPMVKPGATVIDCGINVVEGRVVGDVDGAVAPIAGAMTPVPGGIGPVTNAVLVHHLARAIRSQAAGTPH